MIRQPCTSSDIYQRSFSARLILTAVALAFWFWTQSLIDARPSPASGIGDAIHNAPRLL
jgi:hypothetical protein